MGKKIPKGWRKVKLGEVASLSKNIWKVGDNKLPYIGLEHIEENTFRLKNIGTSREVTSNKFIFTKEEFLFGRLRPYFRKLYRPAFMGICSTDIWVVRPINGVDKNFLFYLFANQEFVDLATKGSSGTRMPRASWEFLKNTLWIIPEKTSEQKAIASVLSSLDDKIELLHRQNKTLESMAEALFRKWFINNPNKSEWKSGTLGDLVKISSGKGLKREKFTSNGLYPVLGANGIIGKVNTFLFNEKLIYTGRVGTLGNVFISTGKAWLSDNTLIIRPLLQELFNFVYFFLKLSDLKKLNVGSTQPLIRQTDLKKLKLFLPDMEILERFQKHTDTLFDKILSNKRQIRTLEKLRDTLLPKLMSGEIRVKF